MALSDSSKINISIKKLAGKAQTSNDKDLANEGLSTGVTLASNTIFGESVSSSPSSSALYTITGGSVEYVRFAVSFIAGTDTASGRHGFELKLPSDYESNSSNPKAGTGPFLNNQVVNTTLGALQLIPPSFGASYEAKPYYGGSSTKGSGTSIPLLDGRDWYMDYFNGIMFQQDPPGTGAHAENPDFVEGYLYIGKFASEIIKSSGTSFFSSPSAGFLNTTGSTAFAGAHGSSYTVTSVGTDVNFFVSGSFDSRGTSVRGTSVFGGDLFSSGTLFAPSGLSGSLTRLIDGSSYLIGGPGINISSGSNGSVTLSLGSSERIKFDRVLTGTIASGVEVNVSSDFSVSRFNFNKIDVFINGQMMASGSGRDYLLNYAKTGSIHFNFDLFTDDIVTTIVSK